MTNQERICNLRTFGYTERESEFLCLAGLHSGYFVRRQFLAFTGRNWGKLDTSLTEKTIQNGHAVRLVFRHRREVFSLCSKKFFEALGDSDNRNRRRHEVFTIKSRLIGLDFVLSHKELEFFPTERGKVAFFHDQLGIDLEKLPAKQYRAKESPESTERYFVDKFPVALDVASGPGAAVIVFCYVDEGLHTTAGFETHLKRYRGVFASVPAFRLLYIATSPTHFGAARRVFENALPAAGKQLQTDRMLVRTIGYFRDREAYERGDLERFDQRKLIRFREDRREFGASKYDELFARWKEHGDDWLLRVLDPESTTAPAANGEFLTCLSPFRYDLFGTLTDRNLRCRGVHPEGVLG